MTRTLLSTALIVALLAVAAGLRLKDLGNRPMHSDEAVHAVKFGRLLEKDDYVYDPHEYHGPSLNFLTLPIAWLAGATRLTELTEVHLRLLPAAFGILLVALVWLVGDGLGRGAALSAALLAAVSPAMVFYSRYYIQEMLLVGFTFGAMIALWRYAQALAVVEERRQDNRSSRLQRAVWLVVLGLSIGMMHASKETCVIALGAMAVAALVSFAPLRRAGLKRLALAGLVVALTAAGVSALFFSSFLDNPRGILDSYKTYSYYLARSLGEGSAGRHDHPWYYYLEILFWRHRTSGPPWSEAAIALLALLGAVAVLSSTIRASKASILRPLRAVTAPLGKALTPATLPTAQFLTVYTLLTTLVYSALPYKTPWSALTFLHGMILLGGVGAAVLLRAVPGYVAKGVVIALLGAAAGQLAWQAHRASFMAYDDPDNPYVYAQTTRDLLGLVDRVEEVAASHPDGKAVPVQVICPDRDYWPLPWYLRGFSRVAWHARMPQGPAAPIIITQPSMEPALRDYLYVQPPPGQRPLYMPVWPEPEGLQWRLRPAVPLRMYVRRDLWEACRAGANAGGA